MTGTPMTGTPMSWEEMKLKLMAVLKNDRYQVLIDGFKADYRERAGDAAELRGLEQDLAWTLAGIGLARLQAPFDPAAGRQIATLRRAALSVAQGHLRGPKP